MCDSDNSLQSQDKLRLESWGLPKSVCEKYKSLGIDRMFPWQLECLSCKDVLTGGNVIYSAPTSAGKTMVAEILVLQTVLERRKKAIIILPFISVVREKMLYFQDLFSSTGIRTEGFMGSYAPPGGLKAVHIAVCTIEKANNIINRLLEDQRLEEIGCVVVDELHLLGDQHRGYLLELLLTKVKYMNLKNPLVEIQIVGMSATLPNLPDLARWLDASLYTTDFRPVPLTEYLVVGNDVLSAVDLSLCHTIQPTIPVTASQNVGILFLCIDTILSGHSALVFCHTRNSCETLSEEIAKEIYRLGCNQSDFSLALQRQLDSSKIRDLLEQLKRCPAGLDQSLKRSVSFGVAFHHAGLTMDERDIIEGAYRTGVIRVIVATTTLSSGVNLPSRRVIIKCPLETREINILSYKQMVGRAGRMGKDTLGESFLICNAKERNMGERIVTAKLPSVNSCLAIGSQTSLKRAVLEVIASGAVNSCSELENYLKCTFLFNNNNFEVTDPVWSCVEYLQNNEFININENVIEATPLAEACLSASISPDQGLKLLKELHKARQCFVLETELHIIYQVTPFSVCEQWGRLDWMDVFQTWNELPVAMKRVGELVGVEESFIVHLMRGTVNVNQESQMKKLAILRRFYTALALQDLVNEVPLPEVAAKFSCSKGMLQSLQQTASTFAGMVTQFSRRLGWSTFELIVEQFTARLQFGVHRELLDLLRLDCLTAVQARALHNASITGLPDLAAASVAVVEKAILKALPFQSENMNLMEVKDCERKARTVWLPGRHAATGREAAILLIQEARSMLQRELGLKEVKWMDSEKEPSDPTISDNSVSATQSLTLAAVDASLHLAENIVLKNPVNICSENSDTCCRSEYRKISENNISDKKESFTFQKLHFGAGIEVHSDNSQKSYEPQDSNSEKREIVKDSEIITPNTISDNNSNHSIECIRKQSLGANENIREADIADNSLQHTNESTYFTYNNDTLVLKSFLEERENSNEIEEGGNTDHGTIMKSRESFDMFDSSVTSLKNANKNCSHQDIYGNIIQKKELSIITSSAVSNNTDKTKNVNFNNENCAMVCNAGKNQITESDSVLQNSDSLECTKTRDSLDMFDSPTHSLKNIVNADAFKSGNLMHNNKDDPEKLNTSCNLEHNDTVLCLLNSDNTLLENVNLSLINNNNNKSEIHTHSSQSRKVTADVYDSDLDDVNCGGDCLLEMSFSKAENNINKRKRKCVEPFYARKKVKETDLLNESKKVMNEEPKLNSEKNKIQLVRSSIKCSEHVKTCENTSMSSESELCKQRDEELLAHNADNQLVLYSVLKSEHKSQKFVDKDLMKIESARNNTNFCINLKPDIVIEEKSLECASSIVISNPETVGIDWDVKSKMAEAIQTSTPVLKKEVNNSQTKCTNENTDMFESTFDVNTQLYKIIDGDSNNKLKLNEHKSDENCVLSDEDTVLATPVNTHNKTTVRKTTQETKTDFKRDSLLNRMSVVDEKTAKDLGINGSKMFISNDRKFTIKCGTTTVSCETPLASVKAYSNQITNSYLEAAFAASFEIDENVEEDDNLIPSSQESTNSVVKSDWISIRKASTHSPKRILDIGSSNKFSYSSGSDIKVSYVGDGSDILVEDFEKLIDKKKTISVKLITEPYKGDNVNAPSIGARIIKNKTQKPISAYYHKDTSLTGIVVYCGQKDVFVINLTKNGSQGVQLLHNILKNEEITVVAYRWKEQVKMLYQCCKVHCITCGFDPLVAHWLLKPHEDISHVTLQEMAKWYSINIHECNKIACEVLLLWDLMKIQKSRLKHNGLYSTFTKIEMPTQKILVSTELSGLCVNNKYIEFLWNRVENKTTELQETIYKLLGRKFNLHSSKCMSKIKQELHTKPEYKEVSGNVLDMIHQWRKLKLLNIKVLSPLQIMSGDRIYSNYVTHTLTGRISMREPNVQCVPRDFNILSENFSFRTAFVANKGNMFIAADFCQLELRLLAHFSQDQNLQSVFKKQDDIFISIAAQWNRILETEVTDVIRQHTKQLCYGIVYGMGPKTLSSELNIDEESAANMILQFKTAFPGIQRYINNCIEECRQKGYVTTIMGRIRYLPDIRKQDRHLQGQAERQAVNTTIQGSAADIVKIAMVSIEKDLSKLQHRELMLTEQSSAHLVLQLHDELIYEVSENRISEVVKMIRHRMESAVKLDVALPVKIQTGLSWGELTVIK